MSELPTHSRAVVVGGGIVGCSTAYHLAKAGWEVLPIKQRRVGEAHAPLSSLTNEPPTAWAARPPYVHSPRSERTGIAIREIPEP